MIVYSIFIIISITQIVFLVEVSDLDSFEWLTKDGPKKPILKVVVQGETIELPLRQAPFCHLAATKSCECFILRKNKMKKKDWNSSQWDVASFVKCDDKVHGHFMSISRYFEVAPTEESKSGGHIIKNYGPGDSSSEAFHGQLADKQEEERHKGNGSNLKYFKALPEYGQLFENETGYIKTKFVVSKSVYEHMEKFQIDVYLQNYVNDANQKISKLNLLIVYQGWVEASDLYTQLNESIVDFFVNKYGYAVYDEDDIHDAVFLIGPTDWWRSSQSRFEANCYDSPGQFVKFFTAKTSTSARYQLQAILYSLGRFFGISNIDKGRCGEPPEGIVWIMSDVGASTKNGTLQWANCSIDLLRENRLKLACLRRKIKSSGSSCGNGLIEDGEECDCVADECQECCTENCKLTKNSVCSNGPCCDASQCQFFGKKKQCRASQDFCDLPELCDGNSAQCPSNYVVANGYECTGSSGEKGYCFNGLCGNRKDMCEWAFYRGSNAQDECYEINLENDKDWGGCGPTFQSIRTGGAKYSACSSDNKLCGKLYCTQPGIELGGRMQYTKESDQFFKLGFTFYSGIKNYSSAICGYMGLKRNYRSLRNDPTFVPNGSSCGDEKMCSMQTCVRLPSGCPKNCPGEKIKHPYTGEIFPAFKLTDDSGGGSSVGSIWLYLLVGCFLLALVIGGIYFVHQKKSKNQLENSSVVSPKPSKEQLASELK